MKAPGKRIAPGLSDVLDNLDISEKIQQAIASGAAPAAAAAVSVAEGPKLIEEYAFTAKDSEAKIDFYDNGTFTITLLDKTTVSGTFAFVDGKLTFNGIELNVTIDEADGSYHCTYTTAAGETIEFVLDAAFVEKLQQKSCTKT